MASKKETYVKLKHEEHVLKRPDTYIGSIESTTEELWYFDRSVSSMKKGPLTFVPGEFKIFDEIVVNAHDQYVRMKENYAHDKTINQVKNISISYNQEIGEISVMNDGEGITIEKHETGMYIPELIFGHLLTSSNYDDDVNTPKHVGGKNGYGAKLTNIFSNKFTIETVDYVNKLKFSITFSNHMQDREKPKITKCKSKPYTKITYIPDYSLFKQEGLTGDMIKIIEKRAYDLAGCTDNSVKISLNDEVIKCNNFEKYIDYYIGTKTETPRAYERVGNRWDICACLNPNFSFEQVSFVNGIYTYQGGKHVDYITNQITKNLCELIKKKKKLTIKPNYIKENIMVFINSTIDNPSFNSQTKECLNTNVSKFGSKCDISTKFLDALSKCGIIERAIDLSSLKDISNQKKTDGKKSNRIKGIPKLDDANWAGTSKSDKCTLILTEGDSAKAMAMAGLSIVGRDRYGVFPLKGKILNVRDPKNMKKLQENSEICNIKKIVGLKTGHVYKDVSDLRYGKVMLLTDQDEDGSHIKGLLFNMFQTLWPSLFNYPGFINSMLTPIVKTKKGKVEKMFYSLKDFETWKINNDNGKGWHSKYYKGLGTSTPAEAKEYFKQLKIVEYTTNQETDIMSIDLAFGKEEHSANNRKLWLSEYNKDNTLDYNCKNVSINDFVNSDLIHFSNSDNVRSIPNLIDGFKPSQRKVLYSALKRNLTNEIRVAQLSGYVSEHAAYHHGEMSLQGTIINMAQDFVGSNNINLLEPIGQFGSRILGGKDAAQPRYIHTKLSDITNIIFNKLDNPLYEYVNDDGDNVEPIYYAPIIPMMLINGGTGIGTGWSTDIPQFNPLDIIKNIKNYLSNSSLSEMPLYYKNFKGLITKVDDNSYVSKGVYSVEDECVTITELPIGVWTEKYKEFLESIIIDSKNKKSIIKYYTSYCTDNSIHFELYFPKGYLTKFIAKKDFYGLEKLLKLTSNINTSNMVYYDHNNKIKKNDSILDMLKEYCDVRLSFYEKRRIYIITELNNEIELLSEKIRFINEYISGIILINNKRRLEIEDQLIQRNFKKYDNSFDYLMRMPIYNLTLDKIDEFNDKLNGKNKELKFYNKSDNKTLWINDLYELENILTKMNSKKTIVKIIKKKK